MERLEEPHDAWISIHGQGDIDDVYAVGSYKASEIGGFAQQLVGGTVRQALNRAVIEEAQHLRAQEGIVAELALQTQTQLGQTNNDGAARRKSPNCDS